eukprot:CAMPEP_0204502006 /NCGR_PEP_ID=MMETSP0471-20130131/100449_1 /ASSEMBLY_ACC=CAM_ASM_000602 /TAXON_ID=2969 /ORGANISM="Oxyrrhis marina" /LENGTH=34 /DNA_ID= /DNA_START= /DNA_END= /DNA_ORIENTATION=
MGAKGAPTNAPAPSPFAGSTPPQQPVFLGSRNHA